MTDFKPTYLYIKQHEVTGLKYFGKTTGSESYLLERYNGGGSRWNRHINKHDATKVKTIWYSLFTDKDDLVEFATFFSEEFDIVKSKKWANILPENGIDGYPAGTKKSKKHLDNWIKSRTGAKWTDAQKERRTSDGNPAYGKKHSTEWKLDASKRNSGSNNNNALEWEITDPDGNKYSCKGLSAFCKKMGWNHRIVYHELHGWKVTKVGCGKGGPGKTK